MQGLKGNDTEGGSDSAPQRLQLDGAAADPALQQEQQQQQLQQQQQQQQQHEEGSVSAPSNGGFSLGAMVLGAGALGCSLWLFVYLQQQKLSFTDFVKDLWRQADAQMTASHDRIQNAVEDMIARAFPEDNEPLLPDFKDLNYPEFLPTLVLDFDGVLAKIGHDRTGGYKLRKRPYSEALVNQLSHFFEVVVWNADQPPVVQTALQQWGLPVTACLNSDNMSRKHGRRIKV
ncbi:uncharacterized protein EMH_0041460 [Eimeria mitis]|uniref:FCP1 homology domain-containing protein n=1 Tax=Eimeria mitis TaxID=44415 RepID=U6KL90_9EIME|nr:uncharacterized protein EMH_0041460 [Eimeria mitis]CDJ36223.1 hypothetical protein, conserved [Eimeria mitis]